MLLTLSLFLVAGILIGASGVIVGVWIGSRGGTYEEGWHDGLRAAEGHFEERAGVTLSVAPEGSLTYATLRSLVFSQAARDAADIRRSFNKDRRRR